MNKMADFAKLLGRELDEEFIVKAENVCKCKLTDKGLLVYVSGTNNKWVIRNSQLYDLISGKYEIANLPWKAKSKEIYFAPFVSSFEKYGKFYATDDSIDDIKYKNGLMCKTQEQAIETAEAMIKVARKMQGFEGEEDEE